MTVILRALDGVRGRALGERMLTPFTDLRAQVLGGGAPTDLRRPSTVEQP